MLWGGICSGELLWGVALGRELLWGGNVALGRECCFAVLGRCSGVGKLNCPRVNWGYEVILFCLLF
ncbi:MAG TPA: hypothetical protein PLB63_11810 [Planctomycetota bacterium]|nr:hypothetical protein [Planctomycetota bacterium]HQB01599.1 hypothetical protein [Planctomycetota bacterium]